LRDIDAGSETLTEFVKECKAVPRGARGRRRRHRGRPQDDDDAQGVLQRAVEWGGRVPTNVVKITRKPPKPHRPAVRAIQPGLNEVMRARMLDEGRQREATC
jgi:hypothetical protein